VQTLAGQRLRTAELVDANRSVLVFMSTTCAPCKTLLPELSRWQQMLDRRLPLHVVVAGTREDVQRVADEYDVTVLVDADSRATSAFAVPGTPSAIEIAPDGRVLTPHAAGAAAIEALIRSAVKRPDDDLSALRIKHVPGAA